LINNRQGGRRRGRGGQRGQNLGGQPGNRQDNRQRGNAAQLLEKYKSMARDAQLSGDRVQTEYYLQYADHYFRVLSENRARFEDQRPRREPDLDEDEGDEELVETNDESAAEERAERQDRSERPDRGDRFNRERRPRRDERVGRETAENEGRQTNGGGETIPFDVLPPAIGRDESETAEVSEEEPRRPRRRSRGPRPADGEDEIAPAA
jgi:Domain of unknown function (DUF4167)